MVTRCFQRIGCSGWYFFSSGETYYYSFRMDCDEFRSRGKEMIEYICNYLGSIESRRVTPSIEPGYLRKLIPEEAPADPEDWDRIMSDVESKIMPGVTHWQHPRFHAYFPSGNSFPSILGDMLSDAIGCIGFSWAASPACTELETIVLDWLGKAIGLPNQFLAFKEGSKGGGVIQTSASECVLVSMLAARAQALKRLKQQHPFVEEGLLLSKLMAYCSKEAHSCVEKAAMICFVKLRILEPDEKSSLRGKTLLMAMEEDETMGLIPFFVSTTLGTTSCCSFDNLPEIGVVCQKFSCVWLHVDGAYAGNAFICPELKHLLDGIEYADSFNTNPNKWLLTNFDCSTMWVRDRIRLTSALVVDPLYLQHGYSDATIDYRHWGVPLSRRFRSLKLWFVLRCFGISGLQKYIRLHIALAKRFEAHVLGDKRFEICNEVKLGLVCFRLKGPDKLNEKLLSNINASGKLHMVPANVNEKYVIRFCVVSHNATEDDIDHAWKVICEFAEDLLEIQAAEKEQELHDEVFELLERKKKETLAHKRSFFVRMVSDPKIYNPSIAKALPSTRRHLTQPSVESPENNITIQPPTSASWISWPLAFLFQGIAEEGSTSDVPIRFRHLDTKVRLKAKSGAASPRQSPSPEGDSSRSPKRSPSSSRKSSLIS
ncbi:aromatic-L-amino-acid decarboxylase-like isoform X2 [Rhynchophorus ferrugineus]|uniref:aromatic-L-amino-acid decarboxylase-like isoform X2 n=1 Tax=Rhynchophorus ferrugineus TaxID=354439 RepID=UPI003FCCE0BA